jgi:RNA polymerase subunit RPABC4/transcription elongation factor Spt4
MKTFLCPTCKQEKLASSFFPSRLKGNAVYCRACAKDNRREYDRKNKTRRQMLCRARYQKNKLEIIARKYGLTREQYQRMIQLQKNKCAICGQPETHKYKGVVVPLSVDHDHKTGRVRELLCRNCNTVVGMSEENLAVLRKAIVYLKKHTATEGP